MKTIVAGILIFSKELLPARLPSKGNAGAECNDRGLSKAPPERPSASRRSPMVDDKFGRKIRPGKGRPTPQAGSIDIENSYPVTVYREFISCHRKPPHRKPTVSPRAIESATRT